MSTETTPQNLTDLIPQASRTAAQKAAAEIDRTFDLAAGQVRAAARAINTVLLSSIDAAGKPVPQADILAALGSRAPALQALLTQFGFPTSPSTAITPKTSP